MNKKSIPKLLKTLNEYFFHSGSLSDGEIGELVANAKLEYDFLMESPDIEMKYQNKQEKALRVLAGIVHTLQSDPASVDSIIDYAMNQAKEDTHE